jgi:chaperonin GroES
MASEVKLQALGLRVVVQPKAKEEKTAGGLYVPPTAQDESKPVVGEVVKLGLGEEGKKFEVKEGDTVYFKQYSPDSVELDGEEYLVVHQDDILAVVK